MNWARTDNVRFRSYATVVFVLTGLLKLGAQHLVGVTKAVEQYTIGCALAQSAAMALRLFPFVLSLDISIITHFRAWMFSAVFFDFDRNSIYYTE